MKKDKSYKFVSPILMWLIFIIGVIIIYFLPGDFEIFKSNDFTKVLFVFCFLYWLFLAMNSIEVHRKAARSVAGINELVTKGIYSKIRHPFYSADIVLGVGIFLIFPTLKVLITIIWLVFILSMWMRLEEIYLINKFGSLYIRYMVFVPRVIPKFKKNQKIVKFKNGD